VRCNCRAVPVQQATGQIGQINESVTSRRTHLALSF
jgi:hypothetical protein